MNIALILSGGTGLRMGGDIPKQYIEVEGNPILAYCLKTFSEDENIDKIQIVADEKWIPFIKESIEKNCSNTSKFAGYSLPGENRQLSIFNGLSDIMKYASSEDKVIIHDGARPLVSKELIDAIINTLDEHEGVTPVLPVKDTVYTIDDSGKFTGTPDRSKLMAGQAPEGFRLGKYYDATKALIPEKIKVVTGSLQTALLYGMDAVSIKGEEENFKVTTPKDLDDFKAIVKQKAVN